MPPCRPVIGEPRAQSFDSRALIHQVLWEVFVAHVRRERSSPGFPYCRRTLAYPACACYSMYNRPPRLRPAGEESHLPSALGGQDAIQKVHIQKNLVHRHPGAQPHETSPRGPSLGTSNVAITREPRGPSTASAWPSSAPASGVTPNIAATSHQRPTHAALSARGQRTSTSPRRRREQTNATAPRVKSGAHN